jgi:hypothetical protein
MAHEAEPPWLSSSFAVRRGIVKAIMLASPGVISAHTHLPLLPTADATNPINSLHEYNCAGRQFQVDDFQAGEKEEWPQATFRTGLPS